MHGDRHGHMHMGNKKEWMKKMMYMDKVMEKLSEEDKKKLTAAQIYAEITLDEKELDIMEDKIKLMAKKYELQKLRKQKKIEMLKMVEDMLKEKD